MKYLRYLRYVIVHRFWVFYYCVGAGIVWRGLTHDLSKFRPSEFLPYARHQFKRMANGYYKPTNTGDQAFDHAWFLHQRRNDHHWQWWVLPNETPGPLEDGMIVLPMSVNACLEMWCDWKGAGRAQGYKGTVITWLQDNRAKMQLHADTLKMLDWLVEREAG